MDIAPALVMLITLMFEFHTSYVRKTFLTIFLHVILYWDIWKCSVLKQIVPSDEMWILYNNVERKRLWGKWNEPPPSTSKTYLHPKEVMLYIWWDWNGVLYYELLQKNQTINSNEYCSQLEQLKTTLDGKCMESVNRRCIIFHQDNKTSFFLLIRQKLLQLG